MIDIHCHCLPGLDDGPADDRAAVELCKALVADGVHTVVATPHQLGAYDPANRAAVVRREVARLRGMLADAGLPLQVEPGGDVRLDERIPALLTKDEILTIADNRTHLLLELPHDTFINPGPLINLLNARGITTVISHPERNRFLIQNKERVTSWIKAGALLQVTAASLLGEFGQEAERAAWHWLEIGEVDLIASDAHDCRRRPPRMTAAAKMIRSRLGEHAAQALCSDNPGRLLSRLNVRAADDDRLELAL